MASNWLSPLTLGRKQDRSLVLASSRYDSPTVHPVSEADDAQDSRQSQEAEPPSLKTLPVELVLLIFELLPLADALCLALTSKGMCTTADLSLSYFAAEIETDTKDTLLCRLERDTTKFTYCFADHKLKPARLRPNEPIEFDHPRHIVWPTETIPPVSFENRFHLSFCTARLVTNYQVLGPQHGIPAHSLAFDRYDWLYPEGARRIESWAANMIHGELFLSSASELFSSGIHTLFPQEGNAPALRTLASWRYIQICSHMKVGGHSGPRQYKGLPWYAKRTTKYHNAGSCQECATDWEVTIEWLDTKRGWTGTVRTWHGLGSCRSPEDKKWQAMSWYDKPYREVPDGAVKELWEKHAGHASAIQLP